MLSTAHFMEARHRYERRESAIASARGEESLRAARKPCCLLLGASDQESAFLRRYGVSAFVHNRLHRRWARSSTRSVDGRLSVALPVLPQPRRVEPDERDAGYYRARRRGAWQVSSWSQDHGRRSNFKWWRTAHAGPFRGQTLYRREGNGNTHSHRNERLFGRAADGPRTRADRPGHAGREDLDFEASPRIDRKRHWANPGVRPPSFASGPKDVDSLCVGSRVNGRPKEYRADRKIRG